VIVLVIMTKVTFIGYFAQCPRLPTVKVFSPQLTKVGDVGRFKILQAINIAVMFLFFCICLHMKQHH